MATSTSVEASGSVTVALRNGAELQNLAVNYHTVVIEYSIAVLMTPSCTCSSNLNE